jgi:hypothetical protein
MSRVIPFVIVALVLVLASPFACAGEPETARRHAVVVEDREPTPAERGGAETVESSLPAPERDSARIRFTLDARGDATYLPELLVIRDGWNYRWPDRVADPMRIWVQTPADTAFDGAWVELVQESFNAWDGLGLPLLFTFVTDSARAEIVVTWVQRFEERMTGRTLWRNDQHGWITGGTIVLARELPDGRPVNREGVRAIARHEVGHLLGLDHTSDSTSIMSAQVFVTGLAEIDRRTVRLAYDLPPGRILF